MSHRTITVASRACQIIDPNNPKAEILPGYQRLWRASESLTYRRFWGNLFKNSYYLIIPMIDHLKNDDLIINALRGRGFKATPQRIAISRFALSRRDHPTAQMIFSEVKKVHPTVSLATVYNTIKILKEAGLIQELNLPQGQTRFDADPRAHINLICLRCGHIRDLEHPSVQEMINRVSTAERFAATGQRFDIYGVCRNCERRDRQISQPEDDQVTGRV